MMPEDTTLDDLTTEQISRLLSRRPAPYMLIWLDSESPHLYIATNMARDCRSHVLREAL